MTLLDFFSRIKVNFREAGVNVGRDSLNIQCPFCDDPSYHCGVHNEKLIFNCWRCQTSGSFYSLVDGLHDRGRYDKALDLHYTVEKVSSSVKSIDVSNVVVQLDSKRQKITLPKKQPSNVDNQLKNWLTVCPEYLEGSFRSRGLSHEVIDFYNIKKGEGNYQGYAIFPISNGDFIARAYVRKSIKYLKSVTKPPFLYGLEQVNKVRPKRLYIVEGCIDCLSLELGTSVALLTSRLSNRMLSSLVKSLPISVEEIIFFLDRDVGDPVKDKFLVKMLHNIKSLMYSVGAVDWSKIALGNDPDEVSLIYGDRKTEILNSSITRY